MQADILRGDVHVVSDEQDSEEEDEEALADGFWGSRGGPSMADEAAIGSERGHTLLDLPLHRMWHLNYS